jgi:hypothetical protein
LYPNPKLKLEQSLWSEMTKIEAPGKPTLASSG